MISLREKTRRHQLQPKQDKRRLLQKLFSADLVVLARSSNPIPFRTRPLIFSALMVLSLKAWESKSLPDLPKTVCSLHDVECLDAEEPPREISRAALSFFASSKSVKSDFEGARSAFNSRAEARRFHPNQQNKCADDRDFEHDRRDHRGRDRQAFAKENKGPDQQRPHRPD